MPLPPSVRIHGGTVLNRFVPARTFGACVDGGEADGMAWLSHPPVVRTMRSAGLPSLAYRLRTELAGEAWHWNPRGAFSEGDRGYWTSSARPGATIRTSYGYRLPRRGDTFDQANDDGYSRLTDGDDGSFWKSNPYLGAAQAQWVLIRLPKAGTIDAVHIRWADPYALRYRIEYWDGPNLSDVDGGQVGVWRAFPTGVLTGQGGDETRGLGGVPNVLWVRLRLLVSSRTPRRPADPRDAVGFAIRELGIGTMRNGRFVDALVHRRDHRQSATWVSSTDPWHRASDRDPRTVQPGLDAVLRSGLTNGKPALLPAGVLYDTPENMASLLRWLRARRYPVRGFELGEEPDGQVCAPEDYAALYLRTADALRAVDPRVVLGGPGLQTIESDYAAWALPSLTKESWSARFVAALRKRGALDRLGFLSFEWYPFDDVAGDPITQLARASGLLERALARQNVPTTIPTFMTEYGYSAYSGPAEVDLPGALLNLDIVGAFLAHGGRAAYLYGYPPSSLAEDRPGRWGALALTLPDGARLPTYWAARLMTEAWCGGAPSCSLLRTESPVPLVAAYAVRRADRRVSILLLNENPRESRTFRLALDGRPILGGNLTQYGPTQYAWHSDGARGRPSRSLPPARSHFGETVALPPYSITVATF